MHIKTKSFLSIAFLVMQTVVFVQFFINGKQHYYAGVIATTILYLLLLYLEKRGTLKITGFVRACIVITVTAHHYLGENYDLYLKSVFFDKLLHVFGTYSFTIFFFQIINQNEWITFSSKKGRFINVTALGLSIGTLFEILEFILDKSFNPAVPYQSGLYDTNLDLISDFIGAIISALHILLR